MAATKGKVQTVLGLVDPSELGRTLMHEHMHLNFMGTFLPPKGADKGKDYCPFTMENLGWIRQNPYAHRSNVAMDDDATHGCMVDELRLFKAAGGGSIVEVTPYGINPHAGRLAEYSKGAGIHIVGGTGFYKLMYQRAADHQLTVEQMTEHSLKELLHGCEGAPDVKCGIIGEVGSDWPIYDFERRGLQSAAAVQEVTGAPVHFHPGRHEAAPAEVLRIFQEAGGDVRRSTMSHVTRTLLTPESLCEFAALGSYVQVDLFGVETSFYSLAPQVDMPSDAQRIRLIAALVEEGYGDRLVVSHDIHTKHRLTKFGGHGFAHIFENVVPMMRMRGISDDVINQILVSNPAAALAFTK